MQNIVSANHIQIFDVAWNSMLPLSGLRCPSESYFIGSTSILTLAGLENILPANAPGPTIYMRFNPITTGAPMAPLAQMAQCVGNTSPLTSALQVFPDNCAGGNAATYSLLCGAILGTCPTP
jgi:hypothetical protein